MGPSNGVLHPALKSMKRTIRKKREFIRWGSIDKDPSQTCSLVDLSNIINEYITKNQLTDRVKKKRVVCDERLLSVLGKRTVNRTKILDLLEPHLLEYQDSSEEDELSDNLEEGAGASKPCKRQRRKGLDKTNGTIRIKVAPRSCFASIVTQNIKLVYLKRSFIQNLTKELDTFNGKVIGSFARVKRDPNDYLQKNSHQLMQVTGTRKLRRQVTVVQELSCYSQVGVTVSRFACCQMMISLRKSVKDGQVKRLTTWDLDGKARDLHQDITYHWIEKELALLRNLIDRASGKGWHRERYEYLERRAQLESPSERERLIQEVPLVIADGIEVEPPAKLAGDENLETNHSPTLILSRISESLDVARKETSSSPKDGETLPSASVSGKQNKSEQVC
ncbi:uncharacterized protein At5g08430-like isoform X2 [Papaver somniferum]|uniref:uncharacterized protein At5g08430-like isoform X2 n=1 Tax=Papaver somniferum TaxID=3469 RepID=UPI000E70095F|nr:uncharacterized protein At5g08430-like isoform X2 [Papaver somniferum]